MLPLLLALSLLAAGPSSAGAQPLISTFEAPPGQGVGVASGLAAVLRTGPWPWGYNLTAVQFQLTASTAGSAWASIRLADEETTRPIGMQLHEPVELGPLSPTTSATWGDVFLATAALPPDVWVGPDTLIAVVFNAEAGFFWAQASGWRSDTGAWESLGTSRNAPVIGRSGALGRGVLACSRAGLASCACHSPLHHRRWRAGVIAGYAWEPADGSTDFLLALDGFE